jgi:F-type H+-transporting ATPase subunit b
MNFAAEELDGMLLFLPEPAEIFWSLVVIIILGVAFYKKFLPTVNEMLDKRTENIEGELANAAKQRVEAQEIYDDYLAKVKNAKLEISQMKDEARVQANKIIESSRQKAAQEAELIINNARRTIVSEQKVAEQELKRQTSSLAMSIVQKMLNNGVSNEARQSKMVDSSIDDFENSISGARRGPRATTASNSSRRNGSANGRSVAREGRRPRRREVKVEGE